MYHDSNNSGKWLMMPWDMDRTLSIYGENCPYHRSSGVWTADNPFLERAIICDPIFNDIKDRTAVLSNTLFSPAHLFPIIDSLQATLVASVAQDITDAISDTTYWKTKIDIEKGFIKNRHSFLQNQFNNWPRSFRVERTPDISRNNVTFCWHPSLDPNGDHITYTHFR